MLLLAATKGRQLKDHRRLSVCLSVRLSVCVTTNSKYLYLPISLSIHLGSL